MSPVRRFRPSFAPVLLGASMLGACTQEPLGTAGDALAPSFAKTKAAPDGCSRFVGDIHQPVMADGLEHFPIGRARLSVGEDGNLVTSNLRRNGNDGACTELPLVGGVEVSIPSAWSWQGHETSHGVIAQNGTQAYEAGLRFRPNGIFLGRYGDGKFAGFMDYGDDACLNTVVVRRNGEVFRSRMGTGRVRFMLPGDFRLDEWSFRDGIGMLRGMDDGENVWSVTGTTDAACRATPKLRTAFNYFSNPKNDGVVLSWATFPSS